jgi:hypothetical protein
VIPILVIRIRTGIATRLLVNQYESCLIKKQASYDYSVKMVKQLQLLKTLQMFKLIKMFKLLQWLFKIGTKLSDKK